MVTRVLVALLWICSAVAMDRTVVPVRNLPNPPSPDHPFFPMFHTLFIGSTRSGKSTLILNMLWRYGFFEAFHHVFFISPHVNPDDIDNNDYVILKDLQNVRLYWELTEQPFDDAVEADKDPNKDNLIIIDDFGYLLMSKECAWIAGRLSTLRHATKEKSVFW